MRPLSVMLVAGEPSGDRLAAELVRELRPRLIELGAQSTPETLPLRTALPPEFFGAGGAALRAAGAEVLCDLTPWASIGLFDVLPRMRHYFRAFQQLFRTALERQPDAIIGVDYGAFNLRFAAAIRHHLCRRRDWFHPWRPVLVQYVSPQVWASRPGRARQMELNLDLLLSILPFEPEWFAQHAPRLRVRFVGHPLVDRWPTTRPARSGSRTRNAPRLVLMPGSRPDEVRRHGPLLVETWRLLRRHWPDLEARCVVPETSLISLLRRQSWPAELALEAGPTSAALQWADLALTKSGTVTLECALAGVPAVVFYKTAPLTYWIGRHLVRVPHLAMPNLLAGQPLYPELVQHEATPQRLAAVTLELWQDEARRMRLQEALQQVRARLGPPGASQRAAEAIVECLRRKPSGLPVADTEAVAASK